jgi:3-deoxy-manno-octulosonate cytidylyltransferase (CMP-KDO synthetase)
MKTLVVIPARYESKRFPGKPLALVAGKSILERAYRIARAAQGVSGVVVATDDARIADHCKSFGAQAIMTDATLPTGSDRAAAVLEQVAHPVEAVINLQGDALLTPPWVIEALAQSLREGARFATPAMRLSEAQLDAFVDAKRVTPSSGTTVVVDASMHALYFSKHVLPFAREKRTVYRHIGVYGYDAATLLAFAALPQSELERAEGLEQLRALEAGMRIKVVPVDYRGRTHWSVDHPEDIAHVEAIIAKEGELAP